MQISLKTILLILIITTKVYCQTSPLCPKYDTTRKAWAFVDCKTQKQVLAAEYRQATKNDDDDSEYGKQPYFWSKFNKDSLKIVDSIGNSLMAASKQGLPLIEYLEVKNPALFSITWKDSTEEHSEIPMLINNKGKAWKPATIPNVYVSYIDSVGENNYIARVIQIYKDSVTLYGNMLVDKQCNPLSKAYGYMYNDIWDKVELIEFTDKETKKSGYLDFNGKVIIYGLYGGTAYDYFVNDYIVLAKNRKQGVLDSKGKTILPFVYHEIRPLENGFFVVKDNSGISNEYVVNTRGKRLTEPVFCQIDSFADGKVWQNWSNKTLLYNSKGKCLSSEKDIEEAGFAVFLQDTKTKILYSRYSEISDKIREFKVILHNSNQYQYIIIDGGITFRGGRSRHEIYNNKINFYDSDILFNREWVLIERISIKNTKTGEEKLLDKQLYYGVLWSFYRE